MKRRRKLLLFQELHIIRRTKKVRRSSRSCKRLVSK
jgi:hypothetical protein